ncbi:uncharacterized protein KY384_002056 [Bacidia gigantensis]|uniref:uncharacterized protein n=1 Tax=Bacidia gigantensis TaxID=2732470 RepID=UPI001D053748|nr:uncharacterized protein KY384_002056 [Bacidia gigantensis]KAG8533273.1 hypothetical protein KY384_002056 [Bacidia gigantensis]
MDEKEKKTMFEGLYALGESSEEECEVEPLDTVVRHQSSKEVHEAQEESFAEESSAGRTALTVTKAPTPSNPSVPSTLSKYPGKMGGQPGSKVGGKRKRGESLISVPEAKQFFRGLAFFFFPNSDINGVRRFRMRKALEYGAVRVIDSKDDTITHIIVDDWLDYQELAKFVDLDAHAEKVVLVNSNYIPDCLGFSALLNPNQRQYRVKGHQEALNARIPAVDNHSINLTDAKHSIEQQEQALSQSNRPDKVSTLQNRHPLDALSLVIEEARATKDLPLDSEGEADAGKGTFLDSSDDESQDERRSKSRSSEPSDKKWQDKFSCMSKNDGNPDGANPNARTIEVLQQMATYYDQTKDHWRTTAYRKAIAQLRKQDERIVTAAQAARLPWIGSRLAAKIEEIVCTNKLRRLESTKLEPNDESLRMFLKIYGVGYAQAQRWVEEGLRLLSDLQQKASLSRNQQIGVAHFDDFNARISREEMGQHESFVRKFLSKAEPTLQVTIGGSYRRGAADSGDVDFIVTKPDASISTIHNIMATRIIPALTKAGYIKTPLATSSREEGSKWHGACTLPRRKDDSSTDSRPWRRIDFLFVPWNELGAALIYFTGNDIFNRSIRLLASKKGMRLNQRGLWKDVLRGPKRQRLTQGTLVEGRDEKKIFEHLGVPWREPWERVC